MTRAFLLGVGCQKGGTTWLHDQLQRHPAVELGFEKEYHVLDSLFVPEYWDYRPHPRRWPKRTYHRMRASLGHKRHRIEYFRANLEAYFDYFRNIVDLDRQVRLTGDITPSYAGLPVAALRHVRASLIARGFEVRVVFLMRDPVERVISAVRMLRRGGSSSDGSHDSSLSESEAVRAHYQTPAYVMRTAYERTIDNIESAFAPGEIHYELFERLFTEDAYRSLSDFLGIEYLKPDFGREVNVSRNENRLDEEVRLSVYNFYKNTYDRAADLFGRETLSALWPNYRSFG